MAILTNKQFGVLAAGGVVGYMVMKGKLKHLVTETLNPISRNNAAYGTVNHIGSKATGNEHFSLGTEIYNRLHPEEEIF